MAFQDELINNQFQLNVVVELGGETYARFQPDSGITIPDENLILGAVNLQPLAVDLRDVRTTLPTNTFEILDIDGIVTNRIGAADNQLLNETAVIKVGFITGSFDFSDYQIFSSALTTKILRRPNAYRFSARENQVLTGLIFDSAGELSADLSDTETTEMFLIDVSNFPDPAVTLQSEKVEIDEEVIIYTGLDSGANSLTGLTRGDLSSTAASHDSGAVVSRIDTITGNPLELLLQIMISTPGNTSGSIYDVLADGLAIDETVIDVAGIEALAVENFGADAGPPDFWR